MNILLDTQILIWLAENPDKIPDEIRLLIIESNILMSAASVWEMAIKISIEKLKLKGSLEIMIANFRNDYDFEMLDIHLQHIYQTQLLPLHHKDPFDRLIIAQAIVEDIQIVSSDEIFDAYGIKRIW